MLFHARETPVLRKPQVTLSGKILSFVDNFTYLGHILSDDLSDDRDILNQNQKLCGRGNMIIRKFKSCSQQVKICLFKAFCYGIYGSSLWSNFKLATLNRLKVNYNNILRRLMNVPPWHSASQLFVGARLRGFQEQQRTCCYGLMQRLQHSENQVVQRVVHSDAQAVSPLWRRWDAVLRAQ